MTAMMEQTKTLPFTEAIDDLYNTQAEASTGLLRRFRQQLWAKLQETGLPTKTTEAYRPMTLRSFYEVDYALSAEETSVDVTPFIHKDCEKSIIVLLNGTFAPALSNITALDDVAEVLPLEQAAVTYGALLDATWRNELKQERDPFALLNGALHAGGVFLYLFPKKQIVTPIQILHVVTEESALYSCARSYCVVGAHTEAKVLQHTVALGNNQHASSDYLALLLEEGARVDHNQVESGALPAKEQGFVRVALQRDSAYSGVTLMREGAFSRYDYHARLMAPNSEVAFNGIYALDNKQQAHTHIRIDHEAPHCRSHQDFRGILKGQSQASFSGKIVVDSEAQKTDAYQLNSNLLLSDHAKIDTQPQLEVLADDVKASHGATIGQLDPATIHYLVTRGIPTEQAEELLLRGFEQEITDKLFVTV